mgnify:CR=1 FL=1
MEAMGLVERLKGLKKYFPDLTHTARNGNRYDFSCPSRDDLFLSAKTTKRAPGRIAPHSVGQCSVDKMKMLLEVDENVNIKQFIQEHPERLLQMMYDNTFDTPIIYYNKDKDVIKFIVKNKDIDWSTVVPNISWTTHWSEWKNSSCLKLNGKSIAEVQFHSTTRVNMANRWFFEKLLQQFEDSFTITDLA